MGRRGVQYVVLCEDRQHEVFARRFLKRIGLVADNHQLRITSSPVARGAADKFVCDIFMPTWNIETWIAYLDGQDVDERRRDYPRLARPRECRKHVAVLTEMCKVGRLRHPAPDSLQAACDEYDTTLRPTG